MQKLSGLQRFRHWRQQNASNLLKLGHIQIFLCNWQQLLDEKSLAFDIFIIFLLNACLQYI